MDLVFFVEAVPPSRSLAIESLRHARVRTQPVTEHIRWGTRPSSSPIDKHVEVSA